MLSEVVLSSLFEPLDWFFTLRDLANGDPLALVGFLPFIPAAAGKMARSLRYMDDIPEGLTDFARYVDDWNDAGGGGRAWEFGADSSSTIDADLWAFQQSYSGMGGTGASNPVNSRYIDRNPADNMANQEWGKSCVPAACRQMLRDLFAQSGLSVDIEESLLRESMGTGRQTGTGFPSQGIVDVLNHMVEGTPLEGVAQFNFGYMDIGIGQQMTVQDVQQLISTNDSIILRVVDGDRHVVILDDIDITTDIVTIRDPWGMQGPAVSGTGNFGRLEWEHFIELWRAGQYGIVLGNI